MSQADGYVRISTQNDTSAAQRSTKQLGDSIAAAFNSSDIENAASAFDNLVDSLRDIDADNLDELGNSALKTGDIIKANLISDTIMSGIKKLGSVLKDVASDAVAGALANEKAFAKASTLLDGHNIKSYYTELMDVSNRAGVAFEELAESMYSALSASVPQDNVVSFVEGSVKLAKGGFTDTATAIDVVTTALNAYQLKMSEATRIQDILIMTQNKGKTTVGELAAYMGKIIPTAKGVNVEFEQLGAMYATITANGVATAEATTYLNSMLNELSKSGSNAEKAMLEAVEGTALAGKKFTELSAMGYDVTDVLAIMDDHAQMTGKSLADMFSSQEASKAAQILLGNMTGFKENIELMANASGAADKAAGTMMDTTAAKIDVAKNKIDNLISSVGEAMLPALGDASDEISEMFQSDEMKDLISDFSDFAKEVLPKLVKSLLELIRKIIECKDQIALAAKAFLIFKGSMAIKNVIGSAVSGLKNLINTVTSAGTTVSGFLSSLSTGGAIGLAVAGVAGLSAAFVALCSHANDAYKKIDELYKESAKSFDHAENLRQEANGLQEIADKYDKINKSLKDPEEKKQALEELQNTFLAQYPEEAKGIDILNGKYEEMAKALGLVVERKRALSEREALVGYSQALQASELEKTVTRYIDMSIAPNLVGGAFDKLIDEFKDGTRKIENLAIESGVGSFSIAAEGSAEEKLKAYNEFYDALRSAVSENPEVLYDTEFGKFLDELDQTINKLTSDVEAFNNAKDKIENWNVPAGQDLTPASENIGGYTLTGTALEEAKKYKEAEERYKKNAAARAAADAAAAAASEEALKKAVEAYNERQAELQFQMKTGVITEEQYYRELERLRETYLAKNTKEWRSSFLETFNFNKKIIEENKSSLKKILDDASNETLSALKNITSARDSLTKKLTDFNKTFEKITETVPETIEVKGNYTITTAEHEVESYKVDSKTIEDNIRALEKYGEMLDALKDRGASDDFMNNIVSMDVDEAMNFGEKLLKMNDKQWDSYFGSLDKLNKTAEEISAKYYQSEVDNLKDNFVGKLKEELFGLDSDMLSLGSDAALSFVEGWNAALGKTDLTVGDVLHSLTGGTTAPSPAAAGVKTAAPAPSSGTEVAHSDNITLPIYLSSYKLADLFISGVNAKNVKVGKNVLNT